MFLDFYINQEKVTIQFVYWINFFFFFFFNDFTERRSISSELWRWSRRRRRHSTNTPPSYGRSGTICGRRRRLSWRLFPLILETRTTPLTTPIFYGTPAARTRVSLSTPQKPEEWGENSFSHIKLILKTNQSPAATAAVVAGTTARFVRKVVVVVGWAVGHWMWRNVEFL